MSSYDVLSLAYDQLTDNVEYEARSNYISGFFHRYGIDDGILLDLACGSGQMTLLFAQKGYDMIGADASAGMLSCAEERALEAGADIRFICQDMRALDLYGTVRGCICTLDSINHLTSIEDVQTVFQKVSLFTEPGGIFVFDVNTIYKHRYVLKDNVFVFETDQQYLVWQNELQPDGVTVHNTVDLFYTENGSVYRRESEFFAEKAYSVARLQKAAEAAGFEICGVYDDMTVHSPVPLSERVYFVCRKRNG